MQFFLVIFFRIFESVILNYIFFSLFLSRPRCLNVDYTVLIFLEIGCTFCFGYKLKFDWICFFLSQNVCSYQIRQDQSEFLWIINWFGGFECSKVLLVSRHNYHNIQPIPRHVVLDDKMRLTLFPSVSLSHSLACMHRLPRTQIKNRSEK